MKNIYGLSKQKQKNKTVMITWPEYCFSLFDDTYKNLKKDKKEKDSDQDNYTYSSFHFCRKKVDLEAC